MLHLNCDIIGEIGKLVVKRLNNGHCVPRSIEEVGIAKGDVLRTRGNLIADIVYAWVDPRIHYD